MCKLLKDVPLPNRREFTKLVMAYNSKYDEPFITERARTDASKSIPDLDSEQAAPFEKQLMHEAAILASKIVSRYRKTLEVLDAKIKAEEGFVESQKTQSTEWAEESYKIEEDAVDGTHLLKDARQRLEFSEKRYRELIQKYGRTPIRYIPHWLYVIFAFLIFAGEIPLNALVFQIFGENQVMTWIMAVIIGLAVPMSAHFVGIKFREHEGRINFANIIKGSLGLSVIVAALYGLSVMRTTYLGEYSEQLGLTDTLVESSMLFFWLNIAVLGAAVMIAYLSHDSVPGFERAESEYYAASKQLKKLENAKTKKLKSSRFKKAKQMKDLQRDYRDGVNRVINLKGCYDMLLKEGQELESQCLNGLNFGVEVYRRENWQARLDKQRPNSFNSDLSFALKLSGMTEKLNNEE